MTSLAGKSVWLDRKIRLWTRSQLGGQLAVIGGSVRDEITTGVDYVVIDRARWTSGQAEPERAALALGIAVLDVEEFYRLLCPDRDEAMELLRGGASARIRWEARLPLATSPVELDLAGADLSGLDLTGFTFRKCDLAGANLSRSILDGASLLGLVGVCLTGVASSQDVTLSSAVRCDFDGVDLFNCTLSGRFEKCSFRRTLLHDASASAVEWINCVATGAELTNADFAGLHAEKLNAPCLQAAGATLARAVFRGGYLDGSVFSRADLEEAVFAEAQVQEADFEQANLTRADMTQADLRKASFRGANLAEADFTDARVVGANFNNTHKRGTKLVLAATPAKTKRTTPTAPVVNSAVPVAQVSRLLEFRDALIGETAWSLSFVVAHPEHGAMIWSLEPTTRNRYRLSCDQRGETRHQTVSDWVQALQDMAATHRAARLQLDTIRVGPHALAERLEYLPHRLLSEMFAVSQSVPQVAADPLPRSLYSALENGPEALLREGETGRQTWRATSEDERRALVSLRGADLSGLDLSELDFSGLDATGANFYGSKLNQARFERTRLENANFNEANLASANFSDADCRGALARTANLTQAKLLRSDWRGATLCGANLSEANLNQARLQAADLIDATLSKLEVHTTLYDDATIFPEDYKREGQWISTSGDLATIPATYYDLLSHANILFVSERRSANYQDISPLWLEVEDETARGVIPSDRGETSFHACRITNTGRFQCAAQDLTPCKQAAKGTCRHVIALVLHLARVERLTLENAARWLQRSLAHEGTLDVAVLNAIFARYAESTQTDYRPNETLPEDYYAL